MKGHLRLLNIACAAKAKWRQITLQKASRESPLYFSVLGGSERGFGIFVESVEDGSKTAEAGLKRGDQVRCVWGQSGPKKWPPRKHSGLLTKYRERRRLALSSPQWTNTLGCDNVVVMLPFFICATGISSLFFSCGFRAAKNVPLCISDHGDQRAEL